MRLVILGAGGYGQTVADVAEQLGQYEKIMFLDDNNPTAAGKCKEFCGFINSNTEFYPAFGNNAVRLDWLTKLKAAGCRIATLIHPDAYVSPKAEIGEGTVVLPKAAVNTGCRVRRGCILNLGALVDHGCVLEDGVHVCLGAIVKGENHIPAGMKIEAGEVIERAAYKGDK